MINFESFVIKLSKDLNPSSLDQSIINNMRKKYFDKQLTFEGWCKVYIDLSLS